MSRARVDFKYVAKLVEDSKKGDSNAFASLFAITYEQQYNLAYSYLWDKALAQDVVFALYLNTLMLLDNLKHSKDFIKYLTRDNMATCEALALEKGIDPPKGKVNIPEWSMDDAKTMLEYIFFEAHYKQNTIPLEVLVEHNNYIMRRFELQKLMVIIVIFMFAVIPMSFIMPKFTVEKAAKPKREALQQYDVDVQSFIPIKTVEATIGGDDTPVYQSGKRQFYVLPEKNGELKVTVTYITRRHSTQTADISNVDHDVPVLQDNQTRDGNVLLYVSDNQGTGIDYKSVFAIDENQNTIRPTSYNGVIGEIVFPMPAVKLDVYIPDRAGNTLHAVINNPTPPVPQEEQPAEEPPPEEAPPEEEAPAEEPPPEEEIIEEEVPAEEAPPEEEIPEEEIIYEEAPVEE